VLTGGADPFRPRRAERPTHPAALPEDDLMREVEIVKGRAGGPGGQHRNKVETLVLLRHTPTGIEASAGERRSAEQNRRVALRRLRLALATEHRVEVPIGDARSDLWRTRCRNERVVCSPKHQDFPAVLAEAMDVLWACGLDPKRAGVRLVCTPTQLIKLTRAHPPALARWNDARQSKGLRRLK